MEDVIKTHLQGKAASFVEQADVIIAVQGKQFLAHTALLSSESPVLADILHEFVATADTKKTGRGLPVVSLWSDSGKDSKSPAGALASVTAAMFEQMLNILYNPFNFFVKQCDNPKDFVPELFWRPLIEDLSDMAQAAHLLQMEPLLEVCDRTIAKLLASEISWDKSEPWRVVYGRRGGVIIVTCVGKKDHRWLEFGMKYGLPSVMAVALSSALKKVMGGEPGVDKAVVLEFLGTLTPAVKVVVVEEMVVCSTSGGRASYHPDVKELANKLAAACGKSA